MLVRRKKHIDYSSEDIRLPSFPSHDMDGESKWQEAMLYTQFFDEAKDGAFSKRCRGLLGFLPKVLLNNRALLGGLDRGLKLVCKSLH